MNDMIKKPPHYNQGGIETWDYIISNGFEYAPGNVIKYVSRYKKKGKPLEDLRKAQAYLEKIISAEETKNEITEQATGGDRDDHSGPGSERRAIPWSQIKGIPRLRP